MGKIRENDMANYQKQNRIYEWYNKAVKYKNTITISNKKGITDCTVIQLLKPLSIRSNNATVEL